MSYLVMECHPGYVILLDEEGRFWKAANFHYEVGQTVYEPMLMREKPKTQRRTSKWISSGIVAIAACFLLFFGFSYYGNYLQPYSSIYLTINPEVQMDLNRKGTIVGLTGTNEDGKTLLEGYDGKGKDKVTVSDELIDRAIEMGFLSEGGRILFSIDCPDELLFQEYGTELRTWASEYLDDEITVTIEIVNFNDGQKEEPSKSNSQTVAPDEQQIPPVSSEPAVPAVTPAPATPSTSDYNDTDYGLNNDGVTNYNDADYGSNNDGVIDRTPPAVETPASEETDYNYDNDGITEYADKNTDYDPDDDNNEDDNDEDDDDNGEDDNDSVDNNDDDD